MVVFHRSLLSPARSSLRWTRSRHANPFRVLRGAHQALPRNRRTFTLARIRTASQTHDPLFPTWKGAGLSRSPRLHAGLFTSMGSNLGIPRSASVGKKYQGEPPFQKREEPLPTETLRTHSAEKPPSHWTSPVQIPGIQRYQLRGRTTAKRSASPRGPLVRGHQYGLRSSALRLAQGSVYAVLKRPRCTKGQVTAPNFATPPEGGVRCISRL